MRRAVVIDLQEHSEIWDDFYDTWLADDRAAEPREDLRTVRDALGLEDG